MLFSKGELGWGTENPKFKDRKKINTIEYLASILLSVESISLPSKLYPNEPKANHKVNRFQAMPRTGQTFVVDGVSTMIDTHLKFPKDHPEMITGGSKTYSKKNESGKYICNHPYFVYI
jgi:hypothetical protein